MILKNSCLLFLILFFIIFLQQYECKKIKHDKYKHKKRQDLELDVTTSSGPIKGVEIACPNFNSPARAFFGIPYAKPPIGDLRFAPPQPSDPWTTPYIANDEGKVCPQLTKNADGSISGIIGDEDCLRLNIYTRQNAENAAVMVYIHGGGFYEGSKRCEEYGPCYFLNESVIVVTIQYRLNIFGFLSTEDDVCPGNNGLKDQLLALNFIKANIIYFGGDPNKITLVGNSAGAASINYLLHTELSRGLFHRVILQSGVSADLWAGVWWKARRKAFATGAALNINTTDSNFLISEMRKKSFQEILLNGIAEASKINQEDGSFATFAPVVEKSSNPNDPPVVTKPPMAEEPVIVVPMIAGYNIMEAAHFPIESAFFKQLFEMDYIYLIPPTLQLPDDATRQIVKQEIAEFYMKNTTAGLNDYDVYLYLTDNMFLRAQINVTRRIAKRALVFYYEFAYNGPLGNQNQFRINNLPYHTDELHYLFGNCTNDDYPTSEDALIRKRLVKMWSNFIKIGFPIPITSSLYDYKNWFPYNEFGNYLSLTINSTFAIKQRVKEEQHIFWQGVYNKGSNTGWY